MFARISCQSQKDVSFTQNHVGRNFLIEDYRRETPKRKKLDAQAAVGWMVII
jgi:hypothetical protein